MKDKVDVLIIASGASDAAVSWSLAETKMRILCLEQGHWMEQSAYLDRRHWPGMPSSLALEQLHLLAEEVRPLLDPNT